MRIDSYYEVGFVYDYLSEDKYQKVLEYQSLSGTQVLYPLVNTSSEYIEDENMKFFLGLGVSDAQVKIIWIEFIQVIVIYIYLDYIIYQIFF